MKRMKAVLLLLATSFFVNSAMAQSKKDVVDVAAGSKDHTTLVAAVKAAN